MNNLNLLAAIAVVAVVVGVVASQHNTTPQQYGGAYDNTAQTQSTEDSPQSRVVPVVSAEEAIKHYNLEYCFGVNQQNQMLQQGYDFSPERERIIRSEMQGCKEARAAYEKIHPPGSIAVGVSSAVNLR